MALPYSVTYECEELNLLPAVPGAQHLFTGRLFLAGNERGNWIIEDIWLLCLTLPERGFRMKQDWVRLESDSALFKMVCAAAQAHDERTKAIRDHVSEELGSPDAIAAARSDELREMRRAS